MLSIQSELCGMLGSFLIRFTDSGVLSDDVVTFFLIAGVLVYLSIPTGNRGPAVSFFSFVLLLELV